MGVSALPSRDPIAAAQAVGTALDRDGVALLPAMDVHETLSLVGTLGLGVRATMLDPWYNKGVGGVRADYDEFVGGLLVGAAGISDHVYLWGFPEIVARFVGQLPEPLDLVAWLTWYYKNNPSVIRGWRSAQMTCLHLSHPGARLFPEHFLNQAQLDRQRAGKLRYMPGPTSVIEGHLDVIEESLMVGFVGKAEQTGHPSQKPVRVFDTLLAMVLDAGEVVLDPMCGSGTTGAAALARGCRAILGDHDPDYVEMAARRLGVRPVELPPVDSGSDPPAGGAGGAGVDRGSRGLAGGAGVDRGAGAEGPRAVTVVR